ncbi:MAG: GNAT family N-acetyltransferase [Comamonas sp.]|uniref:GNAT family N-acetyltransferase n=1 Tax=Comamonas sp. TaxID=34028 RepID=UPI002FC88F8B
MVGIDSSCLFALFVQPRHEGHGLGMALVHTCEHAIFQRHGCAWLETVKDSRAARLYRHLGWGNEVEIEGGDIRLEKRRE